MADPVAHELIADPLTREEAFSIYEEIANYTVKSDENSSLLAAAWLFEDLCEERDIDPFDALAQLLDMPRPELHECEDA